MSGKGELIICISQEKVHTMSHMTTGGALEGQEAEDRGEGNLGQGPYWGFCGQGQAGQRKQFGTSECESFPWALGRRGHPLLSGPGMT